MDAVPRRALAGAGWLVAGGLGCSYQDWHGELVISPAQALETWQEAINPSEQVISPAPQRQRRARARERERERERREDSRW
jgi:hypothetical protein